MPDIYEAALQNIGSDFEMFTPGLIPVTVSQIDPDTGAALTTVEGVPALKRVRKRQPLNVGGGGELGQDECRFVFAAARVTWVVTARDTITEADGTASVWSVENVELIAFNNLVAANVVKKR